MSRRQVPKGGFRQTKRYGYREFGPELYLVRDTRPPVLSTHERAMGYLINTLLPSRGLDEDDLSAEVARIYLEQCAFTNTEDCEPGLTIEQQAARLIDSTYGLDNEITPIQTQREVLKGVYLGKMALERVAVSA